jgi:hypothetical protein
LRHRSLRGFVELELGDALHAAPLGAIDRWTSTIMGHGYGRSTEAFTAIDRRLSATSS